jgi:Asp-tRNA(Asn)/Glu-tRNA(Gln) amidotransferase A subunit family amidase
VGKTRLTIEAGIGMVRGGSPDLIPDGIWMVELAALAEAAMVAPAIDATCASDAAFFAANRLLLRNTFAINYWDGCAISLPCQAPGDLPVGLMLARANGDDADLLGVALAIEAALA